MNIEKTGQIGAMSRGIYVASDFFTDEPRVHYHATGEQRRIEIRIGEAVEMACPGLLNYQWTLTRKPTGSGAYIDQARLLGVDCPGVYEVTVRASGRWSRTLELCAFTRQQMHGNTTRPTDEERLQQRGWLNDPDRTTEQVIERLETKRENIVD